MGRYEEIRARVDIDLLHIDSELVQLPGLIQEAAEGASAAAAEERAAKLALRIVTAEATLKLRSESPPGGKERSEARITSELILQPEVQAAQEALDLAEANTASWRSLVGSLSEKSSLLRKSCDMVIAGFVTPASYAARASRRPPLQGQGT